MSSLKEDLAVYRALFSDELLRSTDGQLLSNAPGDVLRRQLTAIRVRHAEDCPHVQQIDRWLSVDLTDDHLYEVQAAAMMFVVEEIDAWLENFLCERPRLLNVRQLVEHTVEEFQFVCKFDASIALYVLASTGMLEGTFGVCAN